MASFAEGDHTVEVRDSLITSGIGADKKSFVARNLVLTKWYVPHGKTQKEPYYTVYREKYIDELDRATTYMNQISKKRPKPEKAEFIARDAQLPPQAKRPRIRHKNSGAAD